MKRIAIAAMTAACLFAAPAYAGVYGSAGYSHMSASDDDIDVDVGMVTGRIGATFTPNFGAEAEASFGLDEDEVEVMGVPVEMKVKHVLAAYAVGIVPLSENFDLFGRIGVGTAEVEASALGTSIEDSGSGVHYGAGANLWFAKNHGVRADYTRMESIDANVFSIAYAFRF